MIEKQFEVESENEIKTVPKGWRKEIRKRKKGRTAGRHDVYFYSPSNEVFRSKRGLQKYLEESKSDLRITDFDFSWNNGISCSLKEINSSKPGNGKDNLKDPNAENSKEFLQMCEEKTALEFDNTDFICKHKELKELQENFSEIDTRNTNFEEQNLICHSTKDDVMCIAAKELVNAEDVEFSEEQSYFSDIYSGLPCYLKKPEDWEKSRNLNILIRIWKSQVFSCGDPPEKRYFMPILEAITVLANCVSREHHKRSWRGANFRSANQIVLQKGKANFQHLFFHKSLEYVASS